jgi:hypothetical protein
MYHMYLPYVSNQLVVGTVVVELMLTLDLLPETLHMSNM